MPRQPPRRARTPSASCPQAPLRVYRPPAVGGFPPDRWREGLARENLRAGELAPQPDEQRLERETDGKLQFLGVAPRGSYDFARTLGRLQPLARRVLAQLVEPVYVHDRTLRAGCE